MFASETQQPELAVPILPGVEQATEGTARLQRFVDSHFDFAARCLRNFGVAPAEVDDAVQQVMIIVWQKLNDIRPQAERAFVIQTALRIASRSRRTQSRRREVDADGLAALSSGLPGAEELVDGQRARALFDTLLLELPDDLRTVFVLFEVEELSSAEIGEALALPQGTVKSRLRRAREEFTRHVEQLRARNHADGRPP
jgi:RNA polymerase sigma-70 factor (ECF subfamily)